MSKHLENKRCILHIDSSNLLNANYEYFQCVGDFSYE